jgi:hypothetical protein
VHPTPDRNGDRNSLGLGAGSGLVVGLADALEDGRRAYCSAMSGKRWYYVITLSVIAAVMGFVLFTIVTRIAPALS